MGFSTFDPLVNHWAWEEEFHLERNETVKGPVKEM